MAVLAGERAAAPPTVRIDARRRWLGPSLRDLWHHRELLGFLVWRDVKVRYKQTVLGIIWVALQPLATTVVFALVFGRFAGLPSEGVPYPLFVLAAMLPWQLFASAISRAAPSLVNSAPIITKVYFPRVMVPVASVLGGLVDLLIALAALGALFMWYGVPLRLSLVWLPVAVVFALAAASGVAIWLSALNVYFRDVQQALPFLSQLLMFVSPVAYSAELVPEGTLQLLYALNPVTGIVHVFRWSLLGVPVPWDHVAISATVTVVLLFTGLMLFGRVEDSFADVV